MIRNIVSIFFSIVFLSSLLAPAIVCIIDDSVDITIFLSSNDDEEKEGEKNKDKEVVFLEITLNETDFDTLEIENNITYFFKKYAIPHLNLISPPPEFHIL